MLSYTIRTDDLRQDARKSRAAVKSQISLPRDAATSH
jgi:hypothetical protein